MRKHWFVFGVILAAVVKQLLVIGLPIYAIPAAACDDQLIKNWTYSILNKDWTGAFNSFTFLKAPGASIFFAIVAKLHLPYIDLLTFGYTFATLIIVWALRNVIHKKGMLYLTYLIILFNPVSFALATLQRVYRNGLALVITLIVIGCLLNMYFTIMEDKIWMLLGWSILGMISLGYLWIVKEDTIWLLPITIVVAFIAALIIFKKNRHIRSIPRYLCLLLPLVGILITTKFVSYENIKYYGYDGIEYYGAALNDMTSVKVDEPLNNISLSRDTFKLLCKVSPTLAKAREEVLDEMDRYGDYDTNPDDGNVEDGWIGWAITGAFSEAGYYESCEKANDCYKAIYEELEAAYDSGEIEKDTTTKLEKYHIDTSQHRMEVVQNMGAILSFMSDFETVSSKVEESISDYGAGISVFESMTREHAIYEKSENYYEAVGWILFTDYDDENITVYIEDEDGKKYQKVDFLDSTDVADKYPEYKHAKKCRYSLGWGKDENVAYDMVAYVDGKEVGRAKLTEKGAEEVDDTNIENCMDSWFSEGDNDAQIVRATKVVDRLNAITTVYQKTGRVLFYCSILAYIVLTGNLLIGLKKRRIQYVNEWLVATGLFLSILVLAFAVAVTNLEQCPAINYMYLSSAYAVMLTFEMVAISHGVDKIAQLAVKFKHAKGKNREEAQSEKSSIADVNV